MTAGALERDAVLDAVTEVLRRVPFEQLSVELLAVELGCPPSEVASLYPDVPALMRELTVRTMRRASEVATKAVSEASDGASALSSYVSSFVRHYQANFDAFHQTVILRQVVGGARFGLDVETMRKLVYPHINAPFEVMEKKLGADCERYELPGGVHPRRLAWVAHLVAFGMLCGRGLAASVGGVVAHGDDDVLHETSRVLGAAVSSLRQLAALNDVATDLAALRSEAELRAVVPGLLVGVLALDGATLAMRRGDGTLDHAVPEQGMSAFREGRSVNGPAAGPDTEHVVLACPVRYEGEVEGVLTGLRAAHLVDERDLARMETFATMLGLALENVRLYQNLQQQIDVRTEKLKEAHVRLVETQKMAALGKLVAGVAHETNTPAASIVSSNDTLTKALGKLRAQVGERPELEPTLRVIARASGAMSVGARRLSEIVAQLRRFSRLDAAEVQPLDLSAALSDVIAALQHELPEGARVAVELHELPRVLCQQSRIHDLLLNVLRNAAQALEPGGSITVRGSAPSADRVRITVEDDGRGIAAEELPRIFEPSFSAKGGRIRAGLGLATAYQIARDHGGEIGIASEIGRGTTVTIEIGVGVPDKL